MFSIQAIRQLDSWDNNMIFLIIVCILIIYNIFWGNNITCWQVTQPNLFWLVLKFVVTIRTAYDPLLYPPSYPSCRSFHSIFTSLASWYSFKTMSFYMHYLTLECLRQIVNNYFSFTLSNYNMGFHEFEWKCSKMLLKFDHSIPNCSTIYWNQIACSVS